MTVPFACRGSAALLATFVMLAAGCKAKDAADAGEEATAKPAVAATTAPVRVESFTHSVPAIGSVVSRPGRYAALSAPAPARIAHVYVTEGQRVSSGQPLVALEQAGFDAAASGAQATLAAAEQNAERARRLANEGILPRKDAEQAAAELARARAEAVTARRVQQLSVLRAPVSGVVTRLSAVLGASAEPAQVLVEVADPSAFDVVLKVGPEEAGAVHQGAHVELRAGERGGDALGAGLVASVGATLDSVSRAVAIRVTTTATRRPLRMGESVYGEIATDVVAGALVIPVDALVPGDELGTYHVFVVGKAGTAVAREVTVGGRTRTTAEITKGLRAGELVVTHGAFGVEDSATVAQPRAAGVAAP